MLAGLTDLIVSAVSGDTTYNVIGRMAEKIRVQSAFATLLPTDQLKMKDFP